MRRALLIASIICSLVYLICVSLPGLAPLHQLPSAAIKLPIASKVASTSLLLVISLLVRPRVTALCLGLAFSVLGDLFLGLDRLASLTPADLFLAGLACFLATHCSYIALFIQNRARGRTETPRRFAISVVFVALWFVLSRLWPALGDMRIPVLVYSLALATMAVTAQLSRFPAVVALGTLLFVSSDAMLALAHFLGPFAYAGPLIWSTYYLAQLFITLGVLHARSVLWEKEKPRSVSEAYRGP